MMKIIIIAMVAIFVAIILSRIEHKTNKIHIRFFMGLSKVFILVFSGMLILGNLFHVEATGKTLLQSSSIIVAIITYVAQKALGNIVGGLSISIAKPFQIGDKVKIVNGSSVISEGIVTDISLRHTVVTTYDKRAEIIPNSVIDESVVINTNYISEVGKFFEVQVGYQSDIEKAIEILKKICEREEHVIRVTEPLLSAYNDSGVTIKATVFTKSVDDNFIACSNIRKKLLVAYRKNGITIPYNTITIERAEDGC